MRIKGEEASKKPSDLIKIRSEGIFIRPQDLIRIAFPSKTGEVQERIFYIASKARDDKIPEYLAIRMQPDGRSFSPMIDTKTNSPSICVFIQSFDDPAAKEVLNKVENQVLANETYRMIQRFLAKDTIAQGFCERNAAYGPKIRGNNFNDGRIVEEFGAANRRLNASNYSAGFYSAGRCAQATMRDVFPPQEEGEPSGLILGS